MNKKEQLKAISDKILSSKELPLSQDNGNLVFGKGNENAKVFIIGEAPGKNEAEQGEPFVGKAGKDLDHYLSIANLSTQNSYIANILKFRPPKNRNPNKEEIKTHTPYLIEQINIIQPKIIVTLGNFATKFLLAEFNVEKMKKIPGVSKLHGQAKKITINKQVFIVYPSYHPAAAIYKRSLKEEIEKDFEKLKEFL